MKKLNFIMILPNSIILRLLAKPVLPAMNWNAGSSGAIILQHLPVDMLAEWEKKDAFQP